jgi:hypothetical protein
VGLNDDLFFIDELRADYPIQLLCSVLKVRRSCYYAWKAGQTYQIKDTDKVMEKEVISVFKEHKRRYGSSATYTNSIHQVVRISGHRDLAFSDIEIAVFIERFQESECVSIKEKEDGKEKRGSIDNFSLQKL